MEDTLRAYFANQLEVDHLRGVEQAAGPPWPAADNPMLTYLLR